MSKLKNRAKSEAMPNQRYYTLRSPKQQALQPQNKVPFNPIKQRQIHRRG